MEESVIVDPQKNRTLLKGFIIGLLVVLLMIPTFFVEGLVRDRQEAQVAAIQDVTSKWAGSQNITGPVLVVPYDEIVRPAIGVPGLVRHLAYFLPDKLDIKSSVVPEKRYRGIYEVMLFSSNIDLTGSFAPLPISKLSIDPTLIHWKDAYVCLNISDERGLREPMILKWNDSSVEVNPGIDQNAVMASGFSASIPIDASRANETVRFSTRISLNGSQQLMFTPVGKETNITMQSSWPDPSFAGAKLPVASSINNNGFTAQWKSLSHTRTFPQQWSDKSFVLSTDAIGTDLFIPLNTYQKTSRSVKYAILCILLTFTAFFLIETTHKLSVHPVQYALVGFALILFYTLLLSISEYTGFNVAYAIAALATTGLITWFVKGLLGSMKLSILLSFVLVLLYTYIFTVLQLEDSALIIGSIGLFITLGVVMYYSRRMKW